VCEIKIEEDRCHRNSWDKTVSGKRLATLKGMIYCMKVGLKKLGYLASPTSQSSDNDKRSGIDRLMDDLDDYVAHADNDVDCDSDGEEEEAIADEQASDATTAMATGQLNATIQQKIDALKIEIKIKEMEKGVRTIGEGEKGDRR
jgi:hypothetical protein